MHRLAGTRRWKPRLETLEDRNLMTFYGGYSTVSELHTYLANTTATYPGITEVIDYGNSYGKNVGGFNTPGNDFIPGDDLLAMRITNEAIPGPKPVFFMMTGLHAREISTPEVGMRWINYLTQNYATNADARWIVDHHEIVVALMSNPDGHRHVVLGTLPKYNDGPWYWRKNGHPNSCTEWPAEFGSYGVDLNRNFDEHWGQGGSSNNPCGETYRGPSIASEPETQGLQTFMSSLFLDQKGPNDSDPAPETTTGIMIDVHTHGGYVLWPWGHTTSPPPNSAGLSNIGNKFATYNGYTAGQSNQTLYETTGTSNSWAYQKLGIPAFTIELDTGGGGFLPNYSATTGIFNDVLPNFLYSAKIARTPYMTVKGPDALTVGATTVGAGMRITASINDTQNGNQTISQAEFYIDIPPWAPGAQPRTMQASDNNFNSTIESVRGRASTSGLAPGEHIIFVRGKDSQGNWGPVSAVFVNVAGGRGAGGRAAELVTMPLAAEETAVPGDKGLVSEEFAAESVGDRIATMANESRTVEAPDRNQSGVVTSRALSQPKLEAAPSGVEEWFRPF